MFTATPLVLSYHMFNRGDLPQAIVKSIACSEFCVLSLMCFLSAAAHGVLFRDTIDPLLRGITGVLAPLGRGIREFVYLVGFVTLTDGCKFDKARAYLAYRRSAEVD